MKSSPLTVKFFVVAASLGLGGAFAQVCPDGSAPHVFGCAHLNHGSKHYKEQLQSDRKAREDAAEREYNKWKNRAQGVREVDSYSALAWHPGANDYWAIWDSNTSEAFAKERALEYCNRAMTSGCTVAVSGKNMAMGIAMADGMITEIAWDTNADVALIAVMKMCESKWGVERCVPFNRIKPSSKVIDSRLDFLNGHVPSPEQTIRYRKGTQTLERSSEPAASYINAGNLEKESRLFVDKWGPKIRQLAERQQNPDLERAQRVR